MYYFWLHPKSVSLITPTDLPESRIDLHNLWLLYFRMSTKTLICMSIFVELHLTYPHGRGLFPRTSPHTRVSIKHCADVYWVEVVRYCGLHRKMTRMRASGLIADLHHKSNRWIIDKATKWLLLLLYVTVRAKGEARLDILVMKDIILALWV